MRLHPIVTQSGGIISVMIQAQFIGDSTDATDKLRIQAYGDPRVNLGGTFTDPANTAFSFTFPATELYVGLTTEMSSKTARFMADLPLQPTQGTPWQEVPGCIDALGSLDCLTVNPVEAATVWAAAIQTQCQALMNTLRAQSPASLASLPDLTV